MQPQDLNMTTTVIGYQLFLFITFGCGQANKELAEAIDLLGLNMENAHNADGPPSEETFERGRFQFLQAEPESTSNHQLNIRQYTKAKGSLDWSVPN